MTDLRVCSKGIGFAATASVATVALTTGALGQGGDNAGSAVPLAMGSQSGTTVGYTNDSDETCPYTGSTSPDVYYSLIPSSTTDMSLDLCESGYDTKIYVYDSSLTLVPLADGSGPACSDDACSSSGGGAFRSFISCVTLDAGSLYFVVVDGWGGDAGPYTLLAGAANPLDCLPPGDCTITCTGTVEGETCDFGATAPNDVFNGGCNCTDPAGCFGTVSCDETICGQSYFDGGFRDTDWYALDITSFGSASLTVTGTAEFQSVVGRVDNGGGTLTCAEIAAFGEVIVTPPCDPISLVTPDVAGTELLLFVGADFTDIVDCNIADPGLVGPDYGVTVTCAVGCPLDLDDSGDVGFGDLLLILSNWGPCP